MDRKAKIIATLGPSSNNEETLRILINRGLDIVRLNFSHGTHQNHLENIQLIRKLSNELHKPITILQDLQGPKLRVGKLPNEGIFLKKDQLVALTPISQDSTFETSNKNITTLPLDVPNLARSVNPKDRILLDDGHLELEVINVENETVNAKVVLGGILTSNKGVNLPGTDLKIPGFTEKDKEDLKFGLQNGIDAVAISIGSGSKEGNKRKKSHSWVSTRSNPTTCNCKIGTTSSN